MDATPRLSSRLLAEFVGTFTLIAVGVGAIVSTATLNGGDPAASLVAVALAHGLAIAVMVAAVGHISGGHFNPAVTTAMFAARQIEARAALAYVVAQLAGGTVGALAVRELYPERAYKAVWGGIPMLAHAVPTGTGIVVEAVLTFLLVWVIFGVAVDAGSGGASYAGLAIGLTITADILMGGVLTGAAMNPARALGPEIAAGRYTDAFVYWVGPLVGAVLAGLAYTAGLGKRSGASA